MLCPDSSQKGIWIGNDDDEEEEMKDKRGLCWSSSEQINNRNFYSLLSITISYSVLVLKESLSFIFILSYYSFFIFLWYSHYIPLFILFHLILTHSLQFIEITSLFPIFLHFSFCLLYPWLPFFFFVCVCGGGLLFPPFLFFSISMFAMYENCYFSLSLYYFSLLFLFSSLYISLILLLFLLLFFAFWHLLSFIFLSTNILLKATLWLFLFFQHFTEYFYLSFAHLQAPKSSELLSETQLRLIIPKLTEEKENFNFKSKQWGLPSSSVLTTCAFQSNHFIY